MIARQRLQELLHYNPETGEFIWKVDRRAQKVAGRVAGHPCKDGYLLIGVDGGVYRAHRLAWFYVNGVWPRDTIDHINRIRNDNRIANLRDVSMSLNRINRAPITRSKSGLRGVCYRADRNKWQASFRKKNLGLFASREEARRAVAAAAYRQFGEFSGFDITDVTASAMRRVVSHKSSSVVHAINMSESGAEKNGKVFRHA